MLKPKVLDALNRQIQHELTAAHNYLAMSVWFDNELLKGFAAYMKKQAAEEQEHAMKILEYVQEQNEMPQLLAIAAPRTTFEAVADACKHARDLEKSNTAAINACYEAAVKENDLATQQMLQWFISEQVEEENWTEEFVAMADKIGNHTGALFMWDHRVGKLAE